MKQLKQPIFYLQWILIIFSILAFVLVVIEGFKMNFDFSTIGFQTYLKLFEPYSILFAATFIVITAHLAIERLGIMTDANTTAFKATNRTNWMQIVRQFLDELKTNDPYLAKDITKQLLALHDYLFERRYKILTPEETEQFFNKFFANHVIFFEEMNTKFLDIRFYRDEKHSYSWDAFRYMILIMLEETYPKFILDLQELYQKEILKFNNNLISKTQFEAAAKKYAQR